MDLLRSTVIDYEGQIESLNFKISKVKASKQKDKFMLQKLENESNDFKQKLSDLQAK